MKCTTTRGRKYRVAGRPFVFAVSRRRRASSIRKQRAVSNCVTSHI
jgi:hypothetical protein